MSKGTGGASFSPRMQERPQRLPASSPDLPAIATLVAEARLRASPCYSTSEEEDVPAFIVWLSPSGER